MSGFFTLVNRIYIWTKTKYQLRCKLFMITDLFCCCIYVPRSYDFWYILAPNDFCFPQIRHPHQIDQIHPIKSGERINWRTPTMNCSHTNPFLPAHELSIVPNPGKKMLITERNINWINIVYNLVTANA